MKTEKPLAKYNSMRDFKKTKEPKGAPVSTKGKNSYLIQKHAASRLHYDFRLELDGVLKSWAVTRGPSYDPADKRLAVEVEDHPVPYGKFEGIIPKGEYGGGTVMLWDVGTWEPVGDPHEGLKKGKLVFKLYGKRLQGEWTLVRMHGGNNPKYRNDKHNNWLLIKHKDEFVIVGTGDTFLAKEITSIVSGRKMEAIAQDADKVWKSNHGEKKKHVILSKEKQAIAGARKGALPRGVHNGGKKLPEFVEPQLATLGDAMPKGKDWVHEVKFDGYRTIARIVDGEVKLLTRKGLDWTHKYSGIAQALKKLKIDNAILDGEIVAVDKDGRSNFLTLQAVLKDEDKTELQYYIFDLLYLNGEKLMQLPLIERKERLQKVLGKASKNIFYSEHFTGGEDKFLQNACDLQLEGVISKRGNEPYRTGRGKDWLKSKCHKRQEFVIGGYTNSSTGAPVIGSLILGYYEGKDLVYCGRVGTGFNQEMAGELYKKLKKMKLDKMPFTKYSDAGRRGTGWKRGVNWAKPDLVCEVEFTEWTTDGHLRHPSFQGLREDKPAREVNKDMPLHINKSKTKQAATKPASGKDSKVNVAGINISHPERIVFPDMGFTKLELAQYYDAVSEWIMPYISERLLSMLRCPGGAGEQCFFQRHAGKGTDKHLVGLKVKGHGDDAPYVAIKDVKGLISLIQNGAIEIHPWGSRIDDVYKPDYIVFDLDPDPAVTWKDVIAGALEIKERMAGLGLESFLKTTGGKGLHVVVPFKRKYEWDVIKPFARTVAETVVADSPKKYIATMSKEKRKGKIFIDYLRNDLTATGIAPYAARAREGATVAVPIAWKELTPKLDPKKFNIKTVPERLAGLKSDPWANFYKTGQSLEKVLKKFIK